MSAWRELVGKTVVGVRIGETRREGMDQADAVIELATESGEKFWIVASDPVSEAYLVQVRLGSVDPAVDPREGYSRVEWKRVR